MCCVSLKPETLLAFGYLDLCLSQLNFIRRIEFRIFSLGRNDSDRVICEITFDWNFEKYIRSPDSWQFNNESFEEMIQLFTVYRCLS